MDTTFRVSCGGGAPVTSGDPHAKQNFATSGLSVPHCEQNGTSSSFAPTGPRHEAPATQNGR